MVPNSKARMKALEAFIADALGTSFASQISDVKSDGTVFVRFRSTSVYSAIGYAERFRNALNGRQLQFVQTDDAKFRMALDQFAPAV